MACGGRRCIEAALERLLDEGLQGNPCLGGMQEPVPLLEWPLIEASYEKETDCVINQLAICVGILSQNCNLGKNFDATEEDFGGISCRILAAECNIVEFHGRQSRLAVDRGQLVKNLLHRHARVPPNDGQVVGYLEGIVDARIEGAETCALNVLHRVEVVCKRSVNGCLLHPSQRGEIGGVSTGVVHHRAWILWSTKRIDGEERVHCVQHIQARPPKVSALGAWETLEGAFEMTTQYPDTLKSWVWFQQGNVGPMKAATSS
jgi:hypothetical protein